MMDAIQTIITVCAWCNREQVESLAWQPLQPPIRYRARSTVTHTICPECKAEQLRQLVSQPVKA